MKQIFNTKNTKSKRQNLRNNMTEYEKILWYKIRYDALGVRFRRQHGIGNYIADFYSPELKLVIEIDGEQHFEDDGLKHDWVRDKYMSELGLRILRLSNIEVKENIEGLIEYLKNVVDEMREKKINLSGK